MFEHGITTSDAYFWLHLHPFDCCIWYYKREVCLRWIKDEAPQLVGGKSKSPDAPVTGAGYLLPKRMPWIGFIEIDSRFFLPWRDQDMTDREWGKRGQKIFEELLHYEILQLPLKHDLTIASTKEDQLRRDYTICSAAADYELKTERRQTPNLFVQRDELNHQPHHTPQGNFRYSDL